MSRRSAVRRLVLAIVWVPLYAVVLYPLTLAILLITGAIEIGGTLLLGCEVSVRPQWVGDIWAWPSDNVAALLNNDREFRWLP